MSKSNKQTKPSRTNRTIKRGTGGKIHYPKPKPRPLPKLDKEK